jgi:hypothetical protein
VPPGRPLVIGSEREGACPRAAGDDGAGGIHLAHAGHQHRQQRAFQSAGVIAPAACDRARHTGQRLLRARGVQGADRDALRQLLDEEAAVPVEGFAVACQSKVGLA